MSMKKTSPLEAGREIKRPPFIPTSSPNGGKSMPLTPSAISVMRVKLYADILQHLSVESNNLLTKDTEAFRSCQIKQDPIYLMNVLKQCHSQIGRQVSDEEKRVKRLELESLKQWDRSGKVIPLPDHDRAWQDLYEEAEAYRSPMGRK